VRDFVDQNFIIVRHLCPKVVQDAYGSRFKNAMHIKAFDKAVKRYRQRVQHGDYARGRHFHLRNRTAAAGDPSSPGKVRSKSRSSSAFSLSLAPGALEEHKTIVSESHARAQKNMEALPDHVLEHAKTFHAYINMFIDDENILDTTRGGSARAIARGGVGDVDSTLKKQLDEIAILGGIGTGAKEEILQDPDARHVSDFPTIHASTHHFPAHRLCSF
jgi:potassium channel subfamily K, other eukaryote